MSETVYERLVECRTVRRYKRDGAPTERELEALVECARIVPNAANLQRLRYALISGKEADSAYYGISMGGYLPDGQKPTFDERPSAYIVVLSECDIDTNLAIDVGIAAEAIVLAASERGFGSCMIRNFKKEVISSFIKREALIPHLVIALGTPAERARLSELGSDGSIKYYRGENGENVVPKRSLSDIMVK